MRFLSFLGALLVLVAIVALGGATLSASAHAALVRSDPAAGARLDTSPGEIRMWFAEPLETSYSGAQLLDSSGNSASGATVAVAPHDDKELILTPPPDLPDGPYTVAWRTLSAADGHTLSGYFGFRVGARTAAGFVPTTEAAGDETARTLTRGLALLGLASLLAIAPVTLIVLDPLGRAVPAAGGALNLALRRYALVAMAVALVTNIGALAAQAVAISPGNGLLAAMGQTLTQTRYGQLWQFRLLLLLVESAVVVAALWGHPTWRRSLLFVATAIGVVLPLPFSLLSHAAAEPAGSGSAIAADALHLLAASIWGGGLLLVVGVLVPVLRILPADTRRLGLRESLPRFSIIGVAAWAILALTGLYAAWLHVGTLDGLRDTPYGQSLLLKGVLLLPALALAAFHFALGWRGPSAGEARRLARTVVAEALIIVVVLLVVGRLIGQEPARTVLASQQPTQLTAPLAFATDGGTRQGRLSVSPGATGVNTFRIDVDGNPLPDGSEGVLRFTFPAQDMGTQERKLAQVGPNQFSADGPELALAGDWQIEALVRKIGSYSWSGQTSLSLSDVPPAAPEPNPPPLFGPGGAVGMVVVAIGLAGLAAATLTRWAATRRRLGVAVIGAAALAAGVVLLTGSRLPGLETAPVLAGAVVTALATPAAASPSADAGHDQMSMDSTFATPVILHGAGTPVSQGGIVVTVRPVPAQPGPTNITIEVRGQYGSPLSGARVVLFAEMAGMGKAGNGLPAQEVAPGRYVVRDVPLSMVGDWHLTVRVSPKGEASQTFLVAVTVS